jgi:predicted AAA+ superfamily ATPase
MIERQAEALIERRLAQFPGVVLLGPRQVGKTTLARAIAARRPGTLILDLEREADRAALSQPQLFLASHRERMLVLDEVQFLPRLFEALRPEIDADRRAGRFLLLGSASGQLLRQAGESLAGRVADVGLTPLLAAEISPDMGRLQQLWLRGVFPWIYLAPDDFASFAWRSSFVRSFLQRDLPSMGVSVPAETMSRFWRMLAHLHGQLFNASQLGLSLGGASHTTAARYLDALVDTMMVRRLEPHLINVGKRLVKSPKIYLRDSGLLHALLGIGSVRDLQGHRLPERRGKVSSWSKLRPNCRRARRWASIARQPARSSIW